MLFIFKVKALVGSYLFFLTVVTFNLVSVVFLFIFRYARGRALAHRPNFTQTYLVKKYFTLCVKYSLWYSYIRQVIVQYTAAFLNVFYFERTIANNSKCCHCLSQCFWCIDYIHWMWQTVCRMYVCWPWTCHKMCSKSFNIHYPCYQCQVNVCLFTWIFKRMAVGEFVIYQDHNKNIENSVVLYIRV